MKKTKGMKFISLLLSMMMVLSLFSVTGMTAQAAANTATEVLKPTVTDGKVTDAKVLEYAGKQWYVIASGSTGVQIASSAVTSVAGETTLVLLAKETWGNQVQFYASDAANVPNSNHYNGSNLQSTIDSFVISENIGTYYTSADEAWKNGLVAGRTLAGGANSGYDNGVYQTIDNIVGTEVTGAILWPLSAAEAGQIGDLSFIGTETWGLRTPAEQEGKRVAFIDSNRMISTWTTNFKGVRPALCLNLTSDILASEKSGESGVYELTKAAAVESVTIDPTTATLTTGGDAVKLTATVAPDNTTDKKVKWSVSGTNADAVKLYSDEACNTEVGTDATETLTVYAKGISAGNATVIATSNADDTKAASCAVTVSPKTYTITWRDYDNTTIDTTQVEEGVVPTHADPTKSNNIMATYTFTGWYPEVVAATRNAYYRAQFNVDPIYYSVGDSIDFGDSVYVRGRDWNDPTLELKGSYTIASVTFDSDNNCYNLVLQSGDNTVELTASGNREFENFVVQIEYGKGTEGNPYRFSVVQLGTVIWKDEDGNILETDENVPEGSRASFDGDYSKESESPEDYYYITRWFSEYNGRIDDTPRPLSGLGSVRFDDNGQRIYHGKLIRVKYLKSGVTYFKFDGIDFNNSYVILRSDISAYQRNDMNIVRNLTLYDTSRNRYQAALATEDGTGTSYFYYNVEEALGDKIGWKCVAGDGTQDNPYTFNIVPYADITWKLDADTVIGTTKAAYGDTPLYEGEGPTKEEDAQYTYTFEGWTPEVVAATADTEYTATFSQTTREYNITWKNDDDSVIDTTRVKYGVKPYHADPEKNEDAHYTYTFSNWSPEITQVTGDAEYTATFTPVEKPHEWGTVTYEWTQDGNTWKCTATRVCEIDDTHIETENVTATSTVEKDATCEEKGDTTYIAKFENPAFETQTKTVTDIEKLGHRFINFLKWVWDGFNKAVAWLFCDNDPDHIETIDVPSMVDTVDTPDCTHEGYIYHVATIDVAGRIYTTVNAETLDQLGHDWYPAYDWDYDGVDDGVTVPDYYLKVTLICNNDEDHKLPLDVTMERIDNEDGSVTFIGHCEYDGVDYTDSITVKVEPSTPDVPTPDEPTPATPDVPTPDVPTPDVPTPDVPTPDVPTPDVPTPDVPTPDVPTPDVPTPDVPTPDVPTPDVPEKELKGILGDVNNDGVVDSADALLILRNSVDMQEFTELQKFLGDVDFDGENITSADALSVLRYSVGMIDNEKIGTPVSKTLA